MYHFVLKEKKKDFIMPMYSFISDKGKIEEVFFGMNDEKIYNGKDGKEIGKWKRLWTVPNASFDSVPLDPYSAKDFARVTNKGGSVGDLFDRSAELSEKRVQKDGIDTFKEGFYKEYKKKHKGNEHPEQRRERAKKKADESGIKVTFGD
jgi:hypothetical protein